MVKWYKTGNDLCIVERVSDTGNHEGIQFVSLTVGPGNVRMRYTESCD